MKSKFVEKLGDQYEIMSGHEVANEIDKIFKDLIKDNNNVKTN